MQRHLTAKLTVPALGLAAALAWPNAADARDPDRSGGQVDILVGGSGCIPSRAGDCKFDGNGRTLTRGSAGFGFDIGWRAHPAFFLGAGYTIGWLTPIWERQDGHRVYRNAFNQGVFAVLRAYLPIWRFDIGLELSPGWSQTTFVAAGSDLRQLSRGFALRPGLSLDFRIGEHMFVGGRVDFIVNLHTRFCTADGDVDCGNRPRTPQLPVHQVLGGVHFGANF